MTSAAPAYDLLLKGGTLLDPAQGIHDRRDLAFQDGKVAAVAERIDPAGVDNVVDVTGKLITPGLIDLHGHFYHGGSGSAVHADQACLSSGTTTGVDAGSSGFLNYGAHEGLRLPGPPHQAAGVHAHQRHRAGGQPGAGRRPPRHADY